MWAVHCSSVSPSLANQSIRLLLRQARQHWNIKQETRMLSQALNRAMPHSRNQLGVNRKELIFYLAVQLYIEAVSLRPHCSLKQYSMIVLLSST